MGECTYRSNIHRIYWSVHPFVVLSRELTYPFQAVSIYTIVHRTRDDIPGPRVNTGALSAWIFLSVAVNCMATALISFKLLRMRREIAKTMPSQDGRLYLGVVALLVESALPLSVSGIAFACFTHVFTLGGRISNIIFSFLWTSFSVSRPHNSESHLTYHPSFWRSLHN